MNRIIRSRLSGVAVILLLPMILMGCTKYWCGVICGYPTYVCTVIPFIPILLCNFYMYSCLFLGGCRLPSAEYCMENPEECAAMYEQMQTQFIELCEEYPEECQEYFDSWVESLEEEAIQ